MNKFDELRKQYPVFIYHSYELCEKSLVFHFQTGEFHFYPKWEFPCEYFSGEYPREYLETAAFSLGMAELVSYWKCACCPTVEIRCGGLSE